MTRALFVTTISGTLRSFLLPFAQHFRAKGWKIDAAATGISGCPDCREAFDNVFEVEWSRSPSDPGNLLYAPRTMRRVLERGEYNIVHVHTPIAAFVTRYAARKLRSQGCLKVVYTAHGFHFFEGGSSLKNAVFLNMEQLAGRWTDRLVVMNREDNEAAFRYNIVPAKYVHYMHGIGVDTDYLTPERISEFEVSNVRNELGLQNDQPLFLMAAGFIPRKRHQDALLAFSKLDNPHANLAFAGDGPQMGAMKDLANRLGIAERVHFLGNREDIPQLICASEALILPSSQEGLPRSIMESLSLCVPVIGSNIRGTSELLADGCGLLVELGDIRALTKAIDWITENKESARAMGKRGRIKMLGDYDTKKIVKLHEELYTDVLGADSIC